jgi:signal transduction histidine kinase
VTSLLEALSAARRADWAAIAAGFAERSSSRGVALMVSDGEKLTVQAALPANPQAAALLSVPLGQGVIGKVARNGHAIRLGADRPGSAGHRELLGIAEGGSVARLCVPAHGIDGNVVGVVSLWRDSSHAYTPEEQSVIQPCADLWGMRVHAQELFDAIDAHRGDREQLIAATVSAQESERRRVAGDLHDGVSTALASMSFHLSAAALSLDAAAHGVDDEDAADLIGKAQSQLRSVRTLATMAYDVTRTAITGLYSEVLAGMGLVAAIRSLAETAPRGMIAVTADDDRAFSDLPEHATTALFRMAQESVTNALKHSNANSIEVSLTRADDAVVLVTHDNGRGFDPRESDATGHYGLSSLAERCATLGAALTIDSAPGEGTTVTVRLAL